MTNTRMSFFMRKLFLAIVLLFLGFEVPATAAEFQEQAMCAAASSAAAFPKISLQRDPANSRRAILILTASDGWTQVYSGPIAETSAKLDFAEDQQTVTATFSKQTLTARMSFNNDDYVCDTRSFGH